MKLKSCELWVTWQVLIGCYTKMTFSDSLTSSILESTLSRLSCFACSGSLLKKPKLRPPPVPLSSWKVEVSFINTKVFESNCFIVSAKSIADVRRLYRWFLVTQIACQLNCFTHTCKIWFVILPVNAIIFFSISEENSLLYQRETSCW